MMAALPALIGIATVAYSMVFPEFKSSSSSSSNPSRAVASTSYTAGMGPFFYGIGKGCISILEDDFRDCQFILTSTSTFLL